MAYKGQPVPSTGHNIGYGKISDGKSVKVTVPGNTKIEAGKFYLLDGFLGCAVQSVTTGTGETAEIALNIEMAEYETDQFTGDPNKGDKLYWNASTKQFTTDATAGSFAGIVTSPKGTGSAIWFVLVPQQAGFKQAAKQNDSTASDVAVLKTDFNNLLAKLKAAGLMAN